MKFTVLTLFPEMFDGFLSNSIVRRAVEKGILQVELVDFRAYTLDKHRKVDDKPYGGAPGMILAVQPIADALKAIDRTHAVTYLFSTEGQKFDQKAAHYLANRKDVEKIILICGHYEGFDQRIDHYIDGKISLGDFVLTGGEIPAMAVIDACTRLLPGAIREESSRDESFEDGLLECPQYTMPEEYDGRKVPSVLLSGHHANIRRWRREESLRRTLRLRPDLLERAWLTKEDREFLQKIAEEESKE